MIKKFLLLLPMIVCVLMVLLTMRSLFNGQFFTVHDTTHAARLVEMNRSLLGGEFPVRWSRNFGFGYSMPLFNFYAPLPYYLGQLPLLMGFDPIIAIKFLYIINGILAFLGMYLLGRKIWGMFGGLICAVMFSLSSYRAVDLFVRGAIGEAFAMVLIPFTFYGIWLALEKKKSGVMILILSLAAILLSHNLTGLITFGMVVLIWLAKMVEFKSKQWGWQLLALVLSLSLALGISSFYVLPAFFEKNLTRVDQTITVGYFDYHNHFLCASQFFKGEWKYGGSVPGCGDDISFSFGVVAWVIFSLASLSVLRLGNRKQKVTSLIIFTGLVVSLFMCIGRSVFIWDHVAILKYFQFPWRFLSFAHVFFAVFCGAIALWLTKWRLSIVVIILLLLGLSYQHLQFYLPEKLQSLDHLNAYYNTSPSWISSEISKTLNDYLPPRISDSALPTSIASRLSVKDGEVLILSDLSTRTVAKVNCVKSCILNVNIFQFPGWKATLDGRPIDLVPLEQGLPIYTILVPGGMHQVEVYFSGTTLEQVSNYLSLSIIIIALALVLKFRI